MPEIPDGPSEGRQRLLTVANRLPITIKKDNGSYNYSISSGGLVTGLSGLPKDSYESLWYGWPGTHVPEEDIPKVEREMMQEQGGVPLWIDDELMDLHYNDFSNGILWPLFHYHANEMSFEEEPWNAYVEVNKQFAQRIAKDVKSNDIVWVHDYHLMLVPQMLREQLASGNTTNVKIGFFLHTPFPSSQEFMKLPYRERVLEGLLHADLVGFHTYDYARHFLSACGKLLELSTSPNGVTFRRKAVHVGAFPIGINPQKELGLLEKESVIQRVAGWKAGQYKDKTVIISVDRLDYIKGLTHKFHAYDMFLQHNPDQVGKVVLIQIAVPSRQDVKEYQTLRSHISELTGRINGKYGNVDYHPVVYLFKSVPSEELIALYALADICLITSTRDGMNLVSYEYVVCQKNNYGSLVMSEFAGAAQNMKGCIMINPWDTGDVMNGLRQAVDMSAQEREDNWKRMNAYVMKFTSAYWGQSFIEELTQIGSTHIQEVRMWKPSDDTPELTPDSSVNGIPSPGSSSSRSPDGAREPLPPTMLDGMVDGDIGS